MATRFEWLVQGISTGWLAAVSASWKSAVTGQQQTLMRLKIYMKRFIGLSFFLLAATFLFSEQAFSSTLTTPSFIIKVQVNCAEGNVTCEDVTYVGTSKKTGKSITLRGKTKHSLCADGVTPCAFQGYEFISGKTYYRVLEDGRLLVMQGKKVLLEETGTWEW